MNLGSNVFGRKFLAKQKFFNKIKKYLKNFLEFFRLFKINFWGMNKQIN